MGEIRFVGTGETHGYPYPVCKKISFQGEYGKLSLNYPCYLSNLEHWTPG